MRRVFRLPAAFIALIEQLARRLFCTAFRAEFALVYRAALFAFPARLLCRAGCAAFRTELARVGGAAGTFPGCLLYTSGRRITGGVTAWLTMPFSASR